MELVIHGNERPEQLAAARAFLSALETLATKRVIPQDETGTLDSTPTAQADSPAPEKPKRGRPAKVVTEPEAPAQQAAPSAPEKPAEAPQPEPAPTPAPAQQAAPSASEKPAEAPKSDAPPKTKDEALAALQKLLALTNMDVCANLLQTFGATSIKTLAEANYGAFVREVEAACAKVAA